MSEPSVTLLLMTYNQAAYLAGAIASALAQEGPPIEILISDNGSTDETPDVVERSLAGYDGSHRVRRHRFPQNLGGPAAHLRAAAALCSGRWLVFQHGDDLSFPHRVASLRPLFADPELLCCYSDVEVIDGAGRRLKAGPQAAPDAGEDPVAWFARVQAFALGACLAIDRRLLALFPPLPDDAFEDQVLPFRAALAGKVRHLAHPLLGYRVHGANTVSDKLAHDSVAALRGSVARSTARLEAVAACRRADLAHARQAWPERRDAFAGLDRVIEQSLAEARLFRDVTCAPWPRRVAAVLSRRWTLPPTQRLKLLVRALTPALELRHRRRRSHSSA